MCTMQVTVSLVATVKHSSDRVRCAALVKTSKLKVRLSFFLNKVNFVHCPYAYEAGAGGCTSQTWALQKLNFSGRS